MTVSTGSRIPPADGTKRPDQPIFSSLPQNLHVIDYLLKINDFHVMM